MSNKQVSKFWWILYLCSKPQLSRKVLLNNVIWELDSEISASSGKRDCLSHHSLHYRQNPVLTGSQLGNQLLTSLWVFSTVKAVKLSSYGVQFFISKIKLSKERFVSFLFNKTFKKIWKQVKNLNLTKRIITNTVEPDVIITFSGLSKFDLDLMSFRATILVSK